MKNVPHDCHLFIIVCYYKLYNANNVSMILMTFWWDLMNKELGAVNINRTSLHSKEQNLISQKVFLKPVIIKFPY
jgi:hypothetical protein